MNAVYTSLSICAKSFKVEKIDIQTIVDVAKSTMSNNESCENENNLESVVNEISSLCFVFTTLE